MRSVCMVYAWYGGREGVYAVFVEYRGCSRFRCINIVFTRHIS